MDKGCSMIIAQNGEIIAFEGDTSYWNLDYRDNFYKYCCKWIIKDKVTVKKNQTGFKRKEKKSKYLGDRFEEWVVKNSNISKDGYSDLCDKKNILAAFRLER